MTVSSTARQQAVGSVCGFDLSAFNTLRAPSHYRAVVGVPLWAHPHRRLTETAVAQTFLIGRAPIGAEEVFMLDLPVLHSGTCHAIALWIDVDGLVSGAPDPARPWNCQGLRLLQTPKELVSGDSLGVRVWQQVGLTRVELRQ